MKDEKQFTSYDEVAAAFDIIQRNDAMPSAGEGCFIIACTLAWAAERIARAIEGNTPPWNDDKEPE